MAENQEINIKDAERKTYVVCGISDDLGKSFFEKPFILEKSKLADEQRKASEASADNVDVIVISEFEAVVVL